MNTYPTISKSAIFASSLILLNNFANSKEESKKYELRENMETHLLHIMPQRIETDQDKFTALFIKVIANLSGALEAESAAMMLLKDAGELFAVEFDLSGSVEDIIAQEAFTKYMVLIALMSGVRISEGQKEIRELSVFHGGGAK